VPIAPLRRRLVLRAASGALASLVSVGCSSYSNAGTAYVAQSVAVVDLNGDGHLDVLSAIAATTPSQSFLSARIQEPAAPGTFQAPVRSPTGLAPVAIAVGDLNGDGLPDVAVADGAAGGGNYFIDVQFQVPGTPGAFSAPVQLALGALQPRDLVLADLDGDGKTDIAVAADGSNAVQVFFQGASSGSFGGRTSFAAGGVPTAVAAGDLTGSGQVDLAVATASGKVSVLLHGATPGTFLPSVDYAAGTSPAGVQIADMNGDGYPDLLVADYAGALLILLQSPTGGGTFEPAVSYSALDYGSCSLAVGDLDGDGRPDVVVANAGRPGDPGSVAVFLQDPATPGALKQATLYQGYWGPVWVALGDLNGDGKLDIAVADGGPSVRFQSQTTPGLFLPPTWLLE